MSTGIDIEQGHVWRIWFDTQRILKTLEASVANQEECELCLYLLQYLLVSGIIPLLERNPGEGTWAVDGKALRERVYALEKQIRLKWTGPKFAGLAMDVASMHRSLDRKLELILKQLAVAPLPTTALQPTEEETADCVQGALERAS